MSFALPALLPNAVLGQTILSPFSLGLEAVGAGGARLESQAETLGAAGRNAGGDSGFCEQEQATVRGGHWAPAPGVGSCATAGCPRTQAAHAAPLCALCGLRDALTAGGGGGPYAANNRSSESDVLTVVTVIVLLAAIPGVVVFRDQGEGRTDLIFVLGKRAIFLDMQSGPAAHATNFLGDALRAANSGYEVLVVRGNMWHYTMHNGVRVARAMGNGPNEMKAAFVRAVSRACARWTPPPSVRACTRRA